MLDWFQPWTKVLEWDEPHAKWFTGGRINASYNCLDRHVKSYRRNKAAIIWEGEPGDKRTLTYQQLLNEVCRCANAMKSLGVKKGDRVTIYLPLTPELSIATLACARIGAIHSVVFAGFSSHALAERNNDAESKLIITADGGWRKGAITPLKQNVDECLAESPTVENVIVLKRTGQDITMQPGRDLNLFRRLPNDLEVKQNQGVAIDGINSNFYRQYDKSLNHKLTSYVRQYECMQGSIVFVNEKSQICETPNANIFFKFSDRWATPKTHAPCLPGTIRKVLIDLKDIEDLPIYIEDIHLDQIEQMEACFLTNSVSYAIPVVSLLGKNLSDSITWSKKIRGLLQK